MKEKNNELRNFDEGNLKEFPYILNEKETKDFWHESIKYIAFGFMFTLITFKFLWLQYILPSFGAVFLYLGFRNLKNENKSFYKASIFSIVNLIFNVLSLIYVNTPLNVNKENIIVLAALSTVFQISFLVIFRKGINSIFKKEDIISRKDPILGLIIWRIIIVIFVITGLGGIWIIFIPTVIYYFYSISSINKLGYQLENVKCKYIKERIVLNKKVIMFIYIISCIFVVGICCVFSNHINLDSIETSPVKEFGIRNKLIDSGVPINIIKDIADEEIAILKNIINIQSFSDNLSFNNNSKNTFKVTSIFIELMNNEMYAIEYFDWGNEGPYWQDGFEIGNSRPLELINGRLLYESEDRDYYASIPRLEGGVIIGKNILGYESQGERITGVINYPYNSTNQRGYVFYKINIHENIIAGNNIVNYKHLSHPFRVPYVEIEKQNLSFSNNMRQHVVTFSTKDKE